MNDILGIIFSHCSSYERSLCAQVCKLWSMESVKQTEILASYCNKMITNYEEAEKCLENGDYHTYVRSKFNYINLERACRGGCLQIAQFMIKKGATDYDNGLRGACSGGHLQLAQFMIDKGAKDYDHGLYEACRGGHLHLAQFMIDKGTTNYDYGLCGACFGGHIQLAQFMIDKGATECSWCNNSKHTF